MFGIKPWEFVGHKNSPIYICDDNENTLREEVDYLKFGITFNYGRSKCIAYLIYNSKENLYKVVYGNFDVCFKIAKQFKDLKSAEDYFNSISSEKNIQEYKKHYENAEKQLKEYEMNEQNQLKLLSEKIALTEGHAKDCLTYYTNWLDKNKNNKETGKQRDLVRKYITWFNMYLDLIK